MNKHLVFVYGTLRQGGVRAITDLYPDSKLIAKAAVNGLLYDLLIEDDKGAYPGLLLDGSASPVTGELYEVDDETLRELDKIEGYVAGNDSSLYFRKSVKAFSHNSGNGIECWVYEFNPNQYPDRKLITSGDWIEYSKAK